VTNLKRSIKKFVAIALLILAMPIVALWVWLMHLMEKEDDREE
jgi:hypothetical protein